MRLNRSLAWSLAVVLVWAVPTTQPADAAPPPGRWVTGGHDHENTRANPAERILSRSSVRRLGVRWTAPTGGDVSATPAVVGNAVYFPDWGGYFHKLNARTGAEIWSRSIADYTGIPGAFSRTSPSIAGDTVYIGTMQGGRVLAIDTATGNLRWSTQVDTHPVASLTQSPVVHDGVVYQGVSSQEEGAATDPNYPCCTFRGSLVAIRAATGRVLWKSYTIPDQGPGTDIFSGAAVWGGTPTVDAASGTVYVATGNNYEIPKAAQECQRAGGTPRECLPAWNSINSIIAFDLRTGRRKWATGQDRFDSWNASCLPGAPPNNCPPMTGPDWDFGDGVHLFTVRDACGRPRRAVGAGQKSGEFWMLDAATGQVLWSSAVGPGGAFGGFEWGTATDGKGIYFVETDSNGLPYRLPDGRTIAYSSYGALDPRTGRVLWQLPEPHGGTAMAAVSTANGVMYFGAMSGWMYAVDAATGALLWEFKGEGSSNAGPAIAGGTVFWGNGYARWSLGTPSRTFYAFGVPRS
jgi:polyvinyl alcohol dehydrogenase (cytochrome)